MAKITNKALAAFPKNTKDLEDPELIRWLSLISLNVPDIRTFQNSVNLSSIGANSYSTETVTVTGVTTNDAVIVNPPVLTAGLYYISARVSGADTIELLFYNDTGGAIDEGSASYTFIAIAR